jgi:hypothetical protein
MDMETEYLIGYFVVIVQYQIIINNQYLLKIDLEQDSITIYPVLFKKL